MTQKFFSGIFAPLMHKLQKHILNKLILNSSQRYADLKPKLVEGNLFMYHLKLLIQQDLICKRKDGRYELTSQGKLYADGLSLESFQSRIQPKIVTLIVCQNEKNEYLLYLRKREPFLGSVGFPYGKIHLGESIKTAAERELVEKTGLSAKFAHRGDAYLTVFNGREFLSQVFCHIFSGEEVRGKLKTNSSIGKCFYSKVEKIADEKFIPGFLDILKLVQKNSDGLFFEEFEYHI